MSELNITYSLNFQDRNFIKCLPKTLKNISKEAHKNIKANFIEIFNNEKDYILDKQSQSFLIMCSYIMAYFNFLNSKDISKELIIGQLKNSLIKSGGGKYVIFFTKLMLWTKVDKRKFIENSTHKSKKAFGSFLTMTEEKEECKFTSIVTKCGIHAFFRRHKIPELTTVFCSWDNLWAKEINKRDCGVIFSRTSTIADNKATCRFEFDFFKSSKHD